MAVVNKTLFEQDCVYIHINANDSGNKDSHVPGKLYLLQKADGVYIEWKAEEVISLDGNNEQEWAVVSSVAYKPDKMSDTVTMNSRTVDTRKRFNVSFDLQDLKSFKRSAPNHGWAFIVFMLMDGTTFPALHFHTGGSKALLKEVGNFLHIKRSPNDSRLFIVQEHDPDMLSKSFDELQLFADSSGHLVSKFIKEPYVATMGGFSKVTNFLRDVLLQQEIPESRPMTEIAELLSEDIIGVEINNQDEPGFEVITKTKLPQRPQVKRSSPLTAQQWASHIDSEGRMKDLDALKETIFRGGIEPTIRVEVWKFLLGYYDWHSTFKSRTEERKKKVDDYFRMKLQWKTISSEQEKRFLMLRERKGLIEKDVTRTDRTHKFFEGDGNQNLQVLNDILMTYCMYNFDLGYVQGMSDLLSPILVIMENEVDAFWCFEGVMELMCHNFEMDQGGMKKQLSQLHTLMQFSDPELCSYLESHESGNFYFCFRWILIMFKREFAFLEIQRLWEVIWTDLPCKNFHLLICLAILDTEKITLIESRFGFTEILKHINDMSGNIHMADTLQKAEAIFLQLKAAKKLPMPLKVILGLDGSPSHSSSNSSSSRSTPVITPTNRESSPRMDLPLHVSGASSASMEGGTNTTTPDDGSIEILSDVDSAVNNYFH